MGTVVTALYGRHRVSLSNQTNEKVMMYHQTNFELPSSFYKKYLPSKKKHTYMIQSIFPDIPENLIIGIRYMFCTFYIDKPSVHMLMALTLFTFAFIGFCYL